MKSLVASVLFALLASTSASLGHEFWISPETYVIQPGENIVANIRVGQKFEGSAYSYIPNNFTRFDLVSGDTVVPVQGRAGDRPALNMAAPTDGLWVVVHETSDSKLTYREWEKFVGFVEHKDLGDTLEQHAARNLPKTDFIEGYRRFVKSLIAVGSGAGADRATGLRTEIVAGANPYTDDTTGGLPVTVLFEGAPRIDALVEIFDRAPDGSVLVTTTRTDQQGRALIPVTPGHEYNVDAVVMLALQANDTMLEPVWESLWAGLTFMVPN